MQQHLEANQNVRSICSRWVFTATLKLETATCCGGDASDVCDQSILRDARSGAPLIPGSTLAGALRGHLADLHGGFRSIEAAEVSELFGGGRSVDQGDASPLVLWDSIGQLPDKLGFEFRDNVKIDTKTGTAEDHKKHDMEVLPPGTCFPITLELIVDDISREPMLVSLLLAALGGLEKSEIALGIKRSRGFGQVSLSQTKVHRFDLSTAKGWMEWLHSDPQSPMPARVQVVNGFAKGVARFLPSLPPVDDKRKRVSIEMELQMEGGILVRSGGSAVDDPDMVHLRSGDLPVLPGTGLAGALRKQAMRIAGIVRKDKGDGHAWVERMFGPVQHGTHGQDLKLEASRLRVSEAAISEGSAMRVSRIQIDRFTQGVVNAALFDEQPHFAGKVKVRLELRNPQPGEAGLLLLLARDLMEGEIPVGGSSSVGRGFLKASGGCVLVDGKETISLTGTEGIQSLEDRVKQFANANPIANGKTQPL